MLLGGPDTGPDKRVLKTAVYLINVPYPSTPDSRPSSNASCSSRAGPPALLALLVMAAVITPAAGCRPIAARRHPSAPVRAAARAELRPVKISSAPLIDGLLDDEAWQQTPMPTGQWLSYNPLHGDSIAQQTTVWITYDADYMYFAFKCDDPEPRRIRTSITRRDNAWPDDWVGLSLDALGSGQIAYHMMVNPSGVQMDMLQTVAGGEDQSVDWVWDSAGRLTETGYAVEIRLPLQSIRFRGGEDVKMGVLFWRRVSRIGVSVSWPALEPGRWVFEKHAALIFPDIQPRLPRQVIPSTTYARSQSRDTPSAWGKADGVGDFGVTTKLGLSPTITLDATVNPDFSQVESDAFQVQVNQRFPVFFSERRPFFMEGAGIFSLAGQGEDNSLQYAVHTRRIVDPIFGAKLTGNVGRVTFATLSAVDQQPGRSLEDGRSAASGRGPRARVQHRAGAIQPRAEQLRGRDRHRHGIRGRTQSRDRKRPRVSPVEEPADQRLRARLAIARAARGRIERRRRGRRQLLLQHDAAGNFRRRRALRPRLPDGHGVPQPRRLDERLGVRRTQFLSGQERSIRGSGASRASRSCRADAIASRAATSCSCCPASASTSRARDSCASIDRSGTKRGRTAGSIADAGGRFGEAQLFRWLNLDGEFNQGLAVFYDALDPYPGPLARFADAGSRCSRTDGSRRAWNTGASRSIASPRANASTTWTS